MSREIKITDKDRRNAVVLTYLKQHEQGKITLTEAARLSRYTVQGFIKLRAKYRRLGADCFQHGNKFKVPHNKIPVELERKILEIWAMPEYDDVNFAVFRDSLEEDWNIKICYTTLQGIFKRNGVISPENHHTKNKTKVHRPRMRREHEGELIQIDGTPYEFFKKFGDNHKYTMHGAVDDATSKITAMYICENECLYGVMELVKQMNQRYGIPCEMYMDRAAWACVTPRHKQELSLVEQLAGVHEKRTQFQRILSELGINQILAWSPQAKGRVERMWRTVQQRYPLWAFRHGIKTVEEANKRMPEFIKYYNKKFAKKAKKSSVWHTAPDDFNDIMFAQFPRRTNRNGVFKFHSYDFTILNCPFVANKIFMLCLSENGLFARMENGKYYDVQLLDDDLGYTISDTMPQVVKNIIYENLQSFAKEISA